MKVVVIGAGNVGTVLGRVIQSAGHEIIQVYSRHLYNAEDLADQLQCSATDDWAGISKDGQLYILAVSDRVIATLPGKWYCEKGLLVHTAGVVSKNALSSLAKNYGVLYPLQSLRKEKPDYESIPLLVDGNTEDDLALITDFAQSISTVVRTADDAYRMNLHVAAVFVNNFTNHLYALAEDYCLKTGVSFSLLKPLITETAERIEDFAPAAMQTGPAVRGDLGTLEKHLELLKEHPALYSLYRQISQSIRATVEHGN